MSTRDLLRFAREVEKSRPRLRRVLKVEELYTEYLTRLPRLPVVRAGFEVLNEFNLRIVSPKALIAVLLCLPERSMDLSAFVRVLPEVFPEDLSRALQVLSGDPGVLAVVLYGSRARGDARPDSDWGGIQFCVSGE
ncbi:nucleotidyltransferase domain-containing protein [Thermosulfurimonas dismutans]|uniref:Nucleotidyltransferase domain-containing protein n=1 Tax=Thermosulfurimonas dismutans TaxID=999894 RepID=A0A179D2U6_9BACT|nr:nucleotidyltransferase domain-containing protein [Thermosulfurimonas dismutans]OAQ20303.1 hypothetical protein TDIS_1658 [Thermosulfurimonas dismutans]